MTKEELLSHYVAVRQRLEKLYNQCECVELELRELEREMTLRDVRFDDLPEVHLDEAIIDLSLADRRAGQPR